MNKVYPDLFGGATLVKKQTPTAQHSIDACGRGEPSIFPVPPSRSLAPVCPR